MSTNSILKLSIAIGISFLPGMLGGLFTQGSLDVWYAMLEKPFFNPPDFIFAPVWISLYVLMGISLFLIWNTKIKEKGKKERYVTLFITQLVLNGLWSIIFFGLQNPVAALVEIIILWVAIAVVIWKFYKISKPAAYILLPYIIWVSFAAFLNFYIVLLN